MFRSISSFFKYFLFCVFFFGWGKGKPHLPIIAREIIFLLIFICVRDIWTAIKQKGDKLRKIFTLTFFSSSSRSFSSLSAPLNQLKNVHLHGACHEWVSERKYVEAHKIGWWGAKINYFLSMWYLNSWVEFGGDNCDWNWKFKKKLILTPFAIINFIWGFEP